MPGAWVELFSDVPGRAVGPVLHVPDVLPPQGSLDVLMEAPDVLDQDVVDVAIVLVLLALRVDRHGRL